MIQDTAADLVVGEVRGVKQHLRHIAVVRVPGRAAPGRARRAVALARAAGGLPGRPREPAARRVREPLVHLTEPVEVKVGAVVHFACRQRRAQLLPRRRGDVRPEALALLARGADAAPLRARHQRLDAVEDY